jgi:ATPase subunit of ABC transporter with duplicated ATPase domains
MNRTNELSREELLNHVINGIMDLSDSELAQFSKQWNTYKQEKEQKNNG